MTVRLALALALALGCAAAPPRVRPAAPADPCDAPVAAPPAALRLAPFYRKHLDAGGVPVVASAAASDASLRAACRVVRRMAGARDDVRARMVAAGARVTVMARTEVTVDVPEHAFLAGDPDTDWNARARGLGGTTAVPTTSCAEENLLCEPGDRYRGENILVHELAHGVLNLGLDAAVPGFRARLEAAFRDARAAGRWDRTYAATNADEYWAEGVQSYFDTNRERVPPDGVHNAVDTRAELLAYDPALHALAAEAFPGLDWSPRCGAAPGETAPR